LFLNESLLLLLLFMSLSTQSENFCIYPHMFVLHCVMYNEMHPFRHWGSPSLLSNGYGSIFPPGIKRPGRDADHSPLSSKGTAVPEHHVMKGYWGSGVIASRILDLGTSWR